VPDDPEAPEQEETAEGYGVFWEPTYGYSPDDIAAELPDGTRVQAVLLLGGRRLGFDRRLPKGTQLYL
jgi:hypothetical protein